MPKKHPLEITFKALIRDYANENGISWENVWDVPLSDYVAYLQREYPTDIRLHSKLPQWEVLEKWWNDEVGNTAWLEDFAKYHPS